MTLAEAVSSWLREEEAVRNLAANVGGDFHELVDDLYRTIKAPGGARGRKVRATRELLERTKAALARMDTAGASPHVPAQDWDWGVPGSPKDLELLEA